MTNLSGPPIPKAVADRLAAALEGTLSSLQTVLESECKDGHRRKRGVIAYANAALADYRSARAHPSPEPVPLYLHGTVTTTTGDIRDPGAWETTERQPSPDRVCPYIVTSDEGSSYCRLAEQPGAPSVVVDLDGLMQKFVRQHQADHSEDMLDMVQQRETQQPDDWRPPCPEIEPIRKLAREVGYAIGEHGSKIRDYDLIAAPWTDEAVAYNVLIDHLCKGLNANLIDGPTGKPLGRRSCCIQIKDRYLKHIDLSIMPRSTMRESSSQGMLDNWQPIETAPRDGTHILLLARWDWDSMGSPSEEHYATRAEWRSDRGGKFDDDTGEYTGAFFSVSSNPYRDEAVDLLGWMPVPQSFEQGRRGRDV